MSSRTITLAAASSLENLQALAEVQDFATTDTGWTYRVLPEPLLTAELARSSNALSASCFDSIAFQPCPYFRNQDRRAMESWNLPGGIWTFIAVFDGHSGHETVDHVLQTLPSTIRESLQFILNSCSSPLLSAEIVSRILSDALLNVDNSIRSEFLRLFPEDVDALRRMTDSQIREVLSGGIDGFNRKLALRCTQGTTAIIALTDPWKNLWIANLGDCQAVLGRHESPGKWSATLINSIHNGGNATEILRIKNEHPGESDCVEDDRVVGFLAPTRALGDTWLKLPALFTRRVFPLLNGDFEAQGSPEFAERILTPPYVLNIPDTYHHIIDTGDSFLILCSDGLPDLYGGMSAQQSADHWVTVIGKTLESVTSGGMPNLSLCLLRDAIGGDDGDAVSRNLTLEMDDQWIDDVSIIVQRLQI